MTFTQYIVRLGIIDHRKGTCHFILGRSSNSSINWKYVFKCVGRRTPEFQIYYICYPSLDDRLLGATSYSSLDIPELTGATVVLNEGNTHGGLGN